MVPSSFEQANHIFDKPPEASYDEVGCLDTFTGLDTEGNMIVISCWKPTKEELEELNRTGRVWCFHWGNGLQPHALSGHNPFSSGEAS